MTAQEYAIKTVEGMQNLSLEEQNETVKYIVQELIKTRENKILSIQSDIDNIQKSTEDLRRHLKV